MLLGAPDSPLYNRAIRGRYPPGSTWKIPMAIAALQQGVITLDNSTLLCGGGIQIGNKFTRCMGNHGRPDLHTVTPEQDEAVVKAMWSVVNEAGTATGIKKACYDIAAKTGTAQVVEVGKTSAGTKITRSLYPMLLLRT